MRFRANPIKELKRKIPLLPNLITAFGLSCGLFCIFRTNLQPADQVNESFLLAMTGLLLLAAFADILDGAVARMLKAESEFGGLFDSLADSISFGVAPAMIILKTVGADPASTTSFWMTLAGMIFSVCGVLRLVRFNLLAQAAKQDEILNSANKKHFTGLPIPAAAAAAISLNLWLLSKDRVMVWDISEGTQFWLLFSGLIVLGYFMISRWKFLSIKTFRVPVASFELVFLTVLTAVLLFYGIYHHFASVFLIISWGYIMVAWALALFRIIAGKRIKTLEEFDPEEGDFLDQKDDEEDEE